MMLTAHFSLDELTASQAADRLGLDNTPDRKARTNLGYLATDLEAIRMMLGNQPIIISSGYRSPLVNEAVGGSRHSAHTDGRAADFICPKYGSPLEVCRLIAVSKLDFDQLIHEWRWVHYAIPEPGKDGRREVLTAHFYPGQQTSYTRGLT